VVLLPSTTVTASGVSTSTGGYGRISATDVMWAEFLLNVTAAATAAGDTLDVYIQATSDDGTTWDDFVHFSQILGNGGAKKELFRWQGMIAPTTDHAAPADASLAVATIKQGPHGTVWRVKWVVASASAPSFTFSVTGSGHEKQVSMASVP
jgi:hypothetical protein